MSFVGSFPAILAVFSQEVEITAVILTRSDTANGSSAVLARSFSLPQTASPSELSKNSLPSSDAGSELTAVRILLEDVLELVQGESLVSYLFQQLAPDVGLGSFPSYVALPSLLAGTGADSSLPPVVKALQDSLSSEEESYRIFGSSVAGVGSDLSMIAQLISDQSLISDSIIGGVLQRLLDSATAGGRIVVRGLFQPETALGSDWYVRIEDDVALLTDSIALFMIPLRDSAEASESVPYRTIIEEEQLAFTEVLAKLVNDSATFYNFVWFVRIPRTDSGEASDLKTWYMIQAVDSSRFLDALLKRATDPALFSDLKNLIVSVLDAERMIQGIAYIERSFYENGIGVEVLARATADLAGGISSALVGVLAELLSGSSELVSFRSVQLSDLSLGGEAMMKADSDTAVSTSLLSLSVLAGDSGSLSSIIPFKGMTSSDSPVVLSIADMIRYLTDEGATGDLSGLIALDNIFIEDMIASVRSREALIERARQVIEKLRYPSYGDIVHADDINELIDAVYALWWLYLQYISLLYFEGIAIPVELIRIFDDLTKYLWNPKVGE